MSFPIAYLHLVPLAVCLVLAAAWDVGRRRIPNAVTGAIVASGLGVQFFDRGALAALAALGVGAVTIAALYPFWRRGGLGGGDVKLAGAVAIWMGPSSLLVFWLATAVAGGLTALVCLMASRAAVRREVRANLTLAALHQTIPSVSPRGFGRVSVPYAVPIALGAAFAWLWAR